MSNTTDPALTQTISSSKTVLGLVIRRNLVQAEQLVKQIITWCSERKIEVLMEEGSSEQIAAQLLTNVRVATAQELTQQCRYIITLGGDGTMIGIAHFVNGSSPLLIGVNFGTLGFLTEIQPSELFAVLDSVHKGVARIGERTMLRATVLRGGIEVFSGQALNDIVIQKAAHARLLDLDLFVDNENLMRLRADGLIISTPTGSTAYSLAAGGSIVHPAIEVTLLTPICPHSLTSRPLIVNNQCEVKVVVPEYDDRLFVTIDGQQSFDLEPSDTVVAVRSPNSVRFIRSQERSYFEILQSKLNWGIPNRPD